MIDEVESLRAGASAVASPSSNGRRGHGVFRNRSSSLLENSRYLNFLFGLNIPRSISRLIVIGDTSR